MKKIKDMTKCFISKSKIVLIYIKDIFKELDTPQKTAVIAWFIGMTFGLYIPMLQAICFAWTAGVGVGEFCTNAYFDVKDKRENNES
jgi:hypothetical protein